MQLGATWTVLIVALFAGLYEVVEVDYGDYPTSISSFYYSVVTLTTLGYGDLLPVSATARAMAYMQAVFGQLYVAILVAGLVSAYISSRQSQ